jgi:PEP-CTERM motif
VASVLLRLRLVLPNVTRQLALRFVLRGAKNRPEEERHASSINPCRSRRGSIVLSPPLSRNALGYPFLGGDLFTESQSVWGADPTTINAAGLLRDNYNTVYAATSGVFELGIPGAAGFSILFTNADTLLTYLPAFGVPGPLTSDLLNPSSTSSGPFGGEVAALKINVDFSDAGLTLGTLGIPFGDLILNNFDSTLSLLNGLSVREYLDVVNTWLGGGTSLYSIAELAPLTSDLNRSFAGGLVTAFALNNLDVPTQPPPPPVPEPDTWLLLGSGVTGLIAFRRKFAT